jgi:hypothetical protein
LAAKGRLDEARAALVELQRLAAAMPADAIAGQNTVKDVFGVAVAIVQARIAASEKRTAEAISKLRQATAAEDKLAYVSVGRDCALSTQSRHCSNFGPVIQGQQSRRFRMIGVRYMFLG